MRQICFKSQRDKILPYEDENARRVRRRVSNPKGIKFYATSLRREKREFAVSNPKGIKFYASCASYRRRDLPRFQIPKG